MSEKYNDIFPTRLRQLIEEKPTTITAVARELGISRQAVSQYTMGIGQPNADKLLQIAEYFDVSCDWLVGRQGGAKSLDMDLAGVCKFLNMSEESVAFLREFGEFSKDYPGTLGALFASEEFREVMKSMLRYRFSLEVQKIAEGEKMERREKNKLLNAVFIEHFLATNSLGNVIRDWETEIIGEKKSVSDSIYEILKAEQDKD